MKIKEIKKASKVYNIPIDVDTIKEDKLQQGQTIFNISRLLLIKCNDKNYKIYQSFYDIRIDRFCFIIK